MIYRHSSPISNSNYCIIIYIQQILKIVNLPVNYLHYLLTFHHFHLLFLYYSQKFYSLALFTCFQNIFLFFFSKSFISLIPNLSSAYLLSFIQIFTFGYLICPFSLFLLQSLFSHLIVSQ